VEAHFTYLQGGSKKAGAALTDMADKMQDSVGMTRAELAPLIEKVVELGAQGSSSIQKATMAMVVMNEMGGKFESGFTKALQTIQKTANAAGQVKLSPVLLESIRLTGVSFEALQEKLGKDWFKKPTAGADALRDALNDEIGKKGIDIIKAKAGDFGAMWEVAKSKMADAAGKGLKPMIPLIQHMFAGFQKVFPYIHYGFGKVLNMGLRAALFIKTHWDKIKPTLIGIAVLLGLMMLPVIIGAALGVIAIAAVVAVLAVLGYAIGEVVTHLGDIAGWFVGAFHTAGAAVKHAWASMKSFAGKVASMVSGAVGALGDLASGAVSAAADFITGLVNGIKNGAIAVVNAVEGLAGSAVTALKNKLHIGSPSRVMMEMGKFTAAGFAGGIEAGGSGVQRASAGMGQKAVSGASGASAGASKGSVSVTLAPGAIVIQGGSSTQELMAALEEGVVLMFERVAATQGVGASG
jgi:phage-related protein